MWLAANGPPPGPATVVYPAETQQSSEPFFTDYVRKWLEAHLPGGRQQLYQGGLRIETTLDPDQQAAARQQVADFLKGTQPDLRASLVAVEPPTGFVRAFISGGGDFATDQVNYALGGKSAGGVTGGGSGRQPGSAFKPFVLAQALTDGITPETRFSGAPHDVTEPCGKDAKGNNVVLKNYGGASYGTIDLREATWKSVNTVYTRLILEVGVDKVMGLSKEMGLTSVRDYEPGKYCASIALGGESVSPLDMASAYGVFANRGERAEPTPVLRVTDRDGNVIIDNAEPADDTDPQGRTWPTTSRASSRASSSRGTAAGRGLGARPAAGKTGTTEDNKDAWFVGYTPTLSTAVWMGYQNAPGTGTKYLTGIKGVRFGHRRHAPGPDLAGLHDQGAARGADHRSSPSRPRSSPCPTRRSGGSATASSRGPASSPATPGRAGPTSRRRWHRSRSHRPRPSSPARPPPSRAAAASSADGWRPAS